MSRLLSLLRSTCICRQTVVFEHFLSKFHRIVTVRCTQTQPATASSEPVTVGQCSHLNHTDPSISVFHRPTKVSVDVADICQHVERSTIYCRISGEVVDVSLNKNVTKLLHNVQQRIGEEAVNGASVQVQTVDELLSREVKPSYEHMSLLKLYSKLAKLRLTGECSSFIGTVYFILAFVDTQLF